MAGHVENKLETTIATPFANNQIKYTLMSEQNKNFEYSN